MHTKKSTGLSKDWRGLFFDALQVPDAFSAVAAGAGLLADLIQIQTGFEKLLDAAVRQAGADTDVHRPKVIETQSQTTLFLRAFAPFLQRSGSSCFIGNRGFS